MTPTVSAAVNQARATAVRDSHLRPALDVAHHLSLDPAGLMDEPPRRPEEQILNSTRLLRIFRAGLVMALGTIGVLALARV